MEDQMYVVTLITVGASSPSTATTQNLERLKGTRVGKNSPTYKMNALTDISTEQAENSTNTLLIGYY